MTDVDTFVAGDWGSTHLRLFLCTAQDVIEQVDGAGIGALTTSAESTLFDLVEPWRRRHGAMPLFLAGMVGSRNGWREAPYTPCPADMHTLGLAMLRFTARGHDVAIAPGLSCINSHGAPDVMRGEETQILGALSQEPALARGRRLIVLPGTHAKWVLIAESRIESFQTSIAGELYALLQQRSSLASILQTTPQTDQPAGTTDFFDLGLERCLELEDVPLVHVLFEVRTRQLLEAMSRDAALAYLSGLIIGQDVLGALPLVDGVDKDCTVVMIGTPQLNGRYGAALAKHGLRAVSLNGTEMSLAGLRALARQRA